MTPNQSRLHDETLHALAIDPRQFAALCAPLLPPELGRETARSFDEFLDDLRTLVAGAADVADAARRGAPSVDVLAQLLKLAHIAGVLDEGRWLSLLEQVRDALDGPDILLALLSHQDPQIRLLATERLAHGGDRRLLPQIKACYAAEDDSLVKGCIAITLCRCGDPSGYNLLWEPLTRADIDQARLLLLTLLSELPDDQIAGLPLHADLARHRAELVGELDELLASLAEEDRQMDEQED